MLNKRVQVKRDYKADSRALPSLLDEDKEKERLKRIELKKINEDNQRKADKRFTNMFKTYGDDK